MAQPVKVPTWATDDNYPAGAAPWSGNPTKSALSGGEMAAGFVPDAQVPAQKINELLNLLCGQVGVLADIAAYNWVDHTTSEGDSEIENVYNAGYSLVTLPPLTGTDTEHLCIFNPAGPFYSATDGDRESWTQMAAPGTGGTVKGIVPGFANGVPHAICWDGSTTGTKQVRRTADNGAGWSNGGTVGADMTHGIYSPTLNRWFLAGSVGAATATIHVSDNLPNSAWPTLTIPGGWNGALFHPSCIAQGSDGVAIGLNSGGGCVYTNDGSTVVHRDIDVGGTTVAICFSEDRQEWLAWTSTRKCWRAPPGMASWTLVSDNAATQIGPTSAPTTVTGSVLIPFGRSYILGGPRLNVSHDGGNTWSRLLVKSFGSNNWTALTKIGGRIVAGALVVEGVNSNLELVKSLRMPSEL